MLCSGNVHAWKIARENRYYCMTEIVCEKCGLVFVVNLSHNGHNGNLRTAGYPGYRAERLHKSLERRLHKTLLKSEMAKVVRVKRAHGSLS